MAALITLCNRALSRIAAGQIASLDEVSIEAREVNREAQPLLNEMVDWSDAFGFGRKRVVLAGLANDRPAEWLYAYAAPSDLSTPIAVRSVEEDAYGLPLGGPVTLPFQDMQPLAYLYEEGRIYTNVETATLVYTKTAVDANDLPPLGQAAFVDELAARVAVPIKKVSARDAQALAQRAEISRRRWVADEENKTPRQSTRYVSDAEYARAGYEG